MNNKKWMSILLCLMLVFTCITPVFADTAATEWTAEDFTYGTQTFETYPSAEFGKKLTVDAWVVTGFSEAGKAKFETNKDLVIPAVDPDGKKVQGVGNNAFYVSKTPWNIESVTFPETSKVAYDDSFWTTTGKGVTQRGDFWIGSNAFQKNAIEKVNFPEGVIYIGNNAFKTNKLSYLEFPETVMWVGQGSFAANPDLKYVDFPEKTDFALQAIVQAFAQTGIKTIQLPSNTETIGKWLFFQCTGMEQITNGNTNENKGGRVHIYLDIPESQELTAYMYHNDAAGTLKTVTQTIIKGKDPAKITNYEFSLEFTEATYTGEDIKPAVRVEELKEACYTVVYENCKNAGTAKAVITGNGDTGFYGTVELEYKIKPAALPNGELEYTEVEFEEGKVYEPKVTVGDLVEGTDFTVEYKDNAAVGTAKAVVTGLGNYEGTFELEFEIKAPATDDNEGGNGGNGDADLGGDDDSDKDDNDDSNKEDNDDADKEDDKEIPKTGDNAHLTLMFVLMLAALAGGYVVRKNYTK